MNAAWNRTIIQALSLAADDAGKSTGIIEMLGFPLGTAEDKGVGIPDGVELGIVDGDKEVEGGSLGDADGLSDGHSIS